MPPMILSVPCPCLYQHFSGVSMRSNVPVHLNSVVGEITLSSSPADAVTSLKVDQGAVVCWVALL